MKSVKYLIALVYIVDENRFSDNKCRRIRKSRNKIIKILTKLKRQNLSKSKNV